MPRCDVAQAVLSSDFHRDFQTNGAHSRIWQSAGEIIQGSESDSRLGTESKGVILRMGVGTCDEPVERDRANEGICVLSRRSRERSQEAGDFTDAGAAITLILFGGRKTQCLANILLVNSADCAARSDTVITLDHDGDLVLKSPNL